MRNSTEIDEFIYYNVLAENNAAFIFNEVKFKNNLNSLHNAFTEFYPKVRIGYSYKTNYIPDVCLSAHKESALAEVVSEMEVDMALINLKDQTQIIFNGPVKTALSIKKVIIAGGIINIDNTRDIDIISDILCENKDIVANVAFRINCDYGNDLSRFGQPKNLIKKQIEDLVVNTQWNIIGFHLHLPHRSLESFAFRIQNFIDALDEMKLRNLSYINIGGGFYGELSHELKEALGIEYAPTFREYGELIGRKFLEYFDKRGYGVLPVLYLEPGSSVVADCFSFVSKIHTEKTFDNRKALVSFAGRHLLSPTNKLVKLPCQVINLRKDELLNCSNDTISYDVVGYTCIESDILGKVEGYSKFDCSNSYIEFSNVGSYSVVMGSNFILPEPPIFKLDVENQLILIRKKRTAQEVLSQFLT